MTHQETSLQNLQQAIQNLEEFKANAERHRQLLSERGVEDRNGLDLFALIDNELRVQHAKCYPLMKQIIEKYQHGQDRT